MRKKMSLNQSVLLLIVTATMVGSLSFVPVIANAQEGSQDLATDSLSTEVPEWAVDDDIVQEDGLFAQSVLPEAFDLRNEGLVTPVKFQNPWSSCWAFGGTSAAEVSILSASGKKYGAEADGEHALLDLSERHLMYFALKPVTESVDAHQVDEGLHTYEPTQQELADNPYVNENAAFDTGDLPVYITSLFAQGIGPVLESKFPYRGANGNSTTDEETGIGSYTKYDDWSIPEVDGQGHTNRLLSDGYVLKNGNVLPEYWDATISYVEPQQESIDAIKQEVLNGHGVSISYYADQSGMYTMSDYDGAGESVNNLYNQYVDEPMNANHSACIVGWDDSYAATNFKTEAPGNGAWIVKNSWGSTKDAVADDLGHVMGKGNYGMKDADDEYTGFFYLSYYDSTIMNAETMEFSADCESEDALITLQHDYMPASKGFYVTRASKDVVSSANVFSTGNTSLSVEGVSTCTAEANMRVTFAIYELSNTAENPTDGELVYRTSWNFEYGGYHRLDLNQPITFKAGKKYSVVSTSSMIGEDGMRLYSAAANRGATQAATDMARELGYNVKAYSVAVVNEGESYLYRDRTWMDWKGYLSGLDIDDDAIDTLETATTYSDAFAVDNFSIKVFAKPVDNSQAQALEEAQQAQREAEERATAAEERATAAEERATAAEERATATEERATAAERKAFAAERDKKEAERAKDDAEKKAASSVKANTMTVKTKLVSAKTAAKTIVKKSRAFTVSMAKGKVTFYKISGNAKIIVGKSGKVIVKKGLKANKTYKVKVLVCAAGSKVNGEAYAPAYKTVTLKVKVKEA